MYIMPKSTNESREQYSPEPAQSRSAVLIKPQLPCKHYSCHRCNKHSTENKSKPPVNMFEENANTANAKIVTIH